MDIEPVNTIQGTLTIYAASESKTVRVYIYIKFVGLTVPQEELNKPATCSLRYVLFPMDELYL